MNVKLVFLAGSWKLDALSFLEAHASVFFHFQTRFPLQSVIASKAKQSQVFARNNRISTSIVAKIHGQFYFPLF